MLNDSWMQFSWNLSQLQDTPEPLPGGLVVRTSNRAEETEVQSVVHRAFSFDMQWSGSYRFIEDDLKRHIHQAFRNHPHTAVVIVHGSRLIAVSCLNIDEDADNHLFTGPCVLPEYRSRGLGTALLLHSLQTLKTSGLHIARAVSKTGITATKFIYPKFASAKDSYDAAPFEFLE